MKEYVAGFLFDNLKTQVALIKKTRPDWQKNLHNGIGGKIEQGETPLQAIFREFKEETGVEIDNWDLFLTLSGDGFCVYFFRAFVSFEILYGVRSTTDEMVIVCPVQNIDSIPTVANVKWLIPMALSMDWERTRKYEVKEIQNV